MQESDKTQVKESYEDYMAKRKLPPWDVNCTTDDERIALILETRNRHRIVPLTDRLDSTFVSNIHT